MAQDMGSEGFDHGGLILISKLLTFRKRDIVNKYKLFSLFKVILRYLNRNLRGQGIFW